MDIQLDNKKINMKNVKSSSALNMFTSLQSKKPDLETRASKVWNCIHDFLPRVYLKKGNAF